MRNITINMRVGIIFCVNSEHKFEYSDGSLHPERPERVERAEKILGEKYKKYVYKARDYTNKEIHDFLIISGHTPYHLFTISKKFNDINSAYSLGQKSQDAVIEEVRCLMTMCDLIKEDKIDVALNIIRPPGHHCCNKQVGGFCLINTAIASAYSLIEKYKKLSIFDIDLHHGGGTQKMMENDKNIMYTSIHNKNVWSDGFYKQGINGEFRDGRIINVALPGQSRNKIYLDKSEYLVSKMKNFSDMVILSCGFDAHKDEMYVGDKISHRMKVGDTYYAKLATKLKENFNKVFLILEGGYNELVISRCLDKMVGNFEKKLK